MSVATAIRKLGTASPARQSQWALLRREFCKRRLAVAASLVLLGIICVSILAPLLANDRPICFVGINRFEFREAGRNLRGLLRQIGGDNSSVAPALLVRSARLQFDQLLAEIPRELAAELRSARDRFDASIVVTDGAERSAKLRTMQQELRPLLESLEINLPAKRYWPVLQSLHWGDIGFVAALALLLTSPLWSRLVDIGASEPHPGRVLLVMCLMPALCSLLWWRLVPVRVDRGDYKSGILAADDADGKANIVYMSVTWPPIAYGLDEYDLDNISAPPVWYPESWRPQRSKSSGAKTDSTAAKDKSRWNTPHMLGTDKTGRDVLCRMIWGGRVSLSVGLVAVAIYVTIGIIIGSLAGYFRGVTDMVLSRIIEIVICFPSFFLILTIVAMRGPGLFNIMVVIGLTSWTGTARLVRGEFLRLVDQEFVLAGKALGYSSLRLIFRHVLPNAMAPVLVSATFGVAGAILTESSLSFLGLGITSPTPSWGSLLADGRDVIDHAPWLIHFPGLAIFITITSYNLIGEALRDAADPRLRGSR